MKIGIDPGCSGAIVILGNDLSYVAHIPMPVMKIGTKSRVNGAALHAFLKDHLRGTFHMACIEQVGAMPGQGVASMFTFGHAAGVVQGVIQGMGISINMITPQAWKKQAGLIGKDKDAARSLAIQLYPTLRWLDAIGKGQALADAILIARCKAPSFEELL
jgi:crossover junction endodeoxyribonuclease RuvC